MYSKVKVTSSEGEYLKIPFQLSAKNEDSIVAVKIINMTSKEESVVIKKLKSFSSPLYSQQVNHSNAIKLNSNDTYEVEIVGYFPNYTPETAFSKLFNSIISSTVAQNDAPTFVGVNALGVTDGFLFEGILLDGQEYGEGTERVKTFIQGKFPSEYNNKNKEGELVYDVIVAFNSDSVESFNYTMYICSEVASSIDDCIVKNISSCANNRCNVSFKESEISGSGLWNTKVPSNFIRIYLKRNTLIGSRAPVTSISSSSFVRSKLFRTLVSISTIDDGVFRYGSRPGVTGQDGLDGTDDWISFAHVQSALELLKSSKSTYFDSNKNKDIEAPLRVDDISFTGFGSKKTTNHSDHNDGVALDVRYNDKTELRNSQIEQGNLSGKIEYYKEDSAGVYTILRNSDVRKLLLSFNTGSSKDNDSAKTVFMENLRAECEDDPSIYAQSKLENASGHGNHAHVYLKDFDYSGSFPGEEVIDEIPENANFTSLGARENKRGRAQTINVESINSGNFRYRYFYYDSRKTKNTRDHSSNDYGWREIREDFTDGGNSTDFDELIFTLKDGNKINSNSNISTYNSVESLGNNKTFKLRVMGYNLVNGKEYCKMLERETIITYGACKEGVEGIEIRDNENKGKCISCSSVNSDGQCDNCGERSAIVNGACQPCGENEKKEDGKCVPCGVGESLRGNVCEYCPGGRDVNGDCVYVQRFPVLKSSEVTYDPLNVSCEQYAVPGEIGFKDIGRKVCSFQVACDDGVTQVNLSTGQAVGEYTYVCHWNPVDGVRKESTQLTKGSVEFSCTNPYGEPPKIVRYCD